ncbi:MAG: hypothetical protein CMJ18_13820 [Phycisphaeraceae bacterium]|nr:hypothetical protein [Phycisphaeraceae bacterium]
METPLTLATFADQVGTRFRIESLDDVALELIEAQPLGGASSQAPTQREPFALVFRGPSSPCLAQGTCRLAHETIGTNDIFLVPIGPDDAGMRYEAVFN